MSECTMSAGEFWFGRMMYTLYFFSFALYPHDVIPCYTHLLMMTSTAVALSHDVDEVAGNGTGTSIGAKL